MKNTYTSDNLWLTVADYYVFGIWNVKKGYSAHRAAKTNVFQG